MAAGRPARGSDRARARRALGVKHKPRRHLKFAGREITYCARTTYPRMPIVSSTAEATCRECLITAELIASGDVVIL